MRSSRESRRRKAIERQNRGYAGLLAETVEDEQWVSQFDAADILGISLLRVGFLIQGGAWSRSTIRRYRQAFRGKQSNERDSAVLMPERCGGPGCSPRMSAEACGEGSEPVLPWGESVRTVGNERSGSY